MDHCARVPMLSYELLSVLLTLACLPVDANGVTINFIASSNPAYNGFGVKLTCSMSGVDSAQPGNSESKYKNLAEISILRNATQEVVTCDALSNNITKTGLFKTTEISCNLVSMEVSFLAEVSLAGNYQCLTTIKENSWQQNLDLKVHEAPSSPEISPPLLAFNDSDPMLINCTSTNGNPPAEIELKVTTNVDTIMTYTTTASKSVFLSLNASIALHEATAICQVKNCPLPNMTAASTIKVNHILLRPGVNASQDALEGDVLNCSKLVDSFPSPVFAWSNISASTYTTQPSSGSVGPVIYSGTLSCTATNNVLQKSVVVTFHIKKYPTTRQKTTSSSHAWLQTNATIAVTKTSTSTSLSSSRAPTKTNDGATSISMAPQSSSTQGSNLLTSVTGSVSSSTSSSQNYEPIIIGVTVSVSLFSAAVVVTIVVLRYCRSRTPPRNLPSSQSTNKIIGENQLYESQDDAEDCMCMTDNDLYGSNPPFCTENISSVIYDEPCHRPSMNSTLLSTSQDKDSHCPSIRPQESDLIAQHSMDDRPAVSSQNEALEVHDESSAAMGSGPGGTPPYVSAISVGTAVDIQANELAGNMSASKQRFTQKKPPHSKSFENLAYMDIQLAESNATEDCSHEED